MDNASWDWSTPVKRVVRVDACDAEVSWLEEPQVSPDGERLARVAYLDGKYGMCRNGVLGEAAYTRIWYPRFSPDGRITALANGENGWTVLVEEETWDGYDSLWNTQFSRDGAHVAATIQQDGAYGMAVDNIPWENLFEHANHCILSPDGAHSAAAVQAEPMGQADVAKFLGGVFGVALDGELWPDRYVNVFDMAFSHDGSRLAAEVRLNLYEYTIVENGKAWDQTFSCVWAPVISPVDGRAVAPVRMAGKWTLAADGKPIWGATFVQCWGQFYSADGKRLAAIVSPAFGRWTLALDGAPWRTTFGDLVEDAVLSPDGRRAACLGKENGQYAVVADDTAWPGRYDMAWKPVFSPDGAHVAARVEKGGKHTVAVNGREFGSGFTAAFDPVFSPDSSKVLIKVVEDGLLVRRVVPVSSFKA